MKPYQIDIIIPKFSTIIALILTHKTTIIATTIATVIAAHLLRRMLKTLHLRRQFPTFTATEPSFCAVCLHGSDGGRRYRRLPQCRHCFHVDCIDTWLQVRSTCPLCRFEIPVHLLPRKQQKEPGFVYLFVYFAMKALRKRIRSNFSKMMLFDGDEL